MIVDDARIMRSMLKKILIEGGYNVVGEASDGEEAIRMYTEQKPDLVTLDLIMPQLNGLEVLKEIIALDPEARVVVITAMKQESLTNQAFTLGAKGFIKKPFFRETVIQTIERVLK